MVPMFHYVAFTLAMFPLILSLVNLYKSVSNGSGRLHAAAMVSLIAAVILALWYARAFALKAQDRAIRAEENFRHYLLTGKPLDKNLRMSQIIALRFASDEEFPELAKKAGAEKLGSKTIKQSIKSWRADHNRA